MSARVSTVAGPDGRRLTSKQAATAHEALLLEAAQHPGVVELVANDDDAATLYTVFAGSHSLATVKALDPARVTAIVAGLAATLADLHALGLVHGRIEPSHVVLGAEGRPLLCGFAGSGRRGEFPAASSTVPAEFVDPASPPGSPLDPRADVYGLGALIHFLVTDAGADPGPARRTWAGWRAASVRRALLNLAARATADDASQRPSARALAAALASAAPEHAVRPEAGRARILDSPPAPGRVSRGRRRSRLVVVAGLSLGVFGLLGLVGAFDRDQASRPSPTPEVAAARSTSSTEATASTATTTATTTTNGRDDPGRVATPTVVVSGGQRYSVGDAGDRAILGDWDCDGADTVALLRPRTGDVFAFGSWATPGHDVTIGVTQRVPGGVGLRADDPDGDGCARLLVDHHDGTTVEVAT